MTAYVTIPVATVQNVLKLPNTALRYKPPMSPEEILALYRQYGIEPPGERKTASDEAVASERISPPSGAAQNSPRAPRSDSAVVWQLRANNEMEPVKVALGLRDDSYTEGAGFVKGE